ncbi:MAG: tetratricopeptide repeat protein [Gallionella sp.]|nr:tetratricopeptide repeat protein [Gallionella sp.]
MSLLLDARRKQQAQQGAEFELSLVEPPNLAAPDRQPIQNIRDASPNLFGVKSPNPAASHTGVRRNLLVALCGAILLLAAGYYWPIVSASNTRPLQPSAIAPILRPIPSAAAAELKTRNTFAAEPAAPHSADNMPKPLLAGIVLPANSRALTIPAFHENNQVRMEGQKTGTVDPLLNNAYLAYRNGNLDTAQQLYRAMLGRDVRNTDALLGMAVIAQQRGEDMLAAQYYSRVLALDPRNALAHTGLSALTADSSDEDHLKTLLNEQQDSAILHFALGNRYAEQSRWSEAQQNYFNAYTLEPDSIEFAFNLAVSLDHLGQSKLAAQYYQRALQLDQQESHPGFDHAQTEQRVLELTR